MYSFFRKFVSKLKYWKCLKLSLIFTQKYAVLSNGGVFWKSLLQFFRRIYALSVGFKMKTVRKSVFECSDKNQLKFWVKVTERNSRHSFLLSIWWITFFRHLNDNGIKRTWLCELVKNVRNRQPCISMNFCTEFSKAEVLPCAYR